MSHVAVLGAGAWGTALSLVLAEHEERVVLWTWQEQHAEELARDRENRAFFPGFALPAAVEPTADLQQALGTADLVVVVVPTPAYRATLERMRPFLSEGCP